jgi:hypothetical protein
MIYGERTDTLTCVVPYAFYRGIEFLVFVERSECNQMTGLNSWVMLILLSVLSPAPVAAIPVFGRRIYQEGKRMTLSGRPGQDLLERPSHECFLSSSPLMACHVHPLSRGQMCSFPSRIVTANPGFLTRFARLLPVATIAVPPFAASERDLARLQSSRTLVSCAHSPARWHR